MEKRVDYPYGFRVIDHQDAAGLEQLYFTDPSGAVIARINGTHDIVTAERC